MNERYASERDVSDGATPLAAVSEPKTPARSIALLEAHLAMLARIQRCEFRKERPDGLSRVLQHHAVDEPAAIVSIEQDDDGLSNFEVERSGYVLRGPKRQLADLRRDDTSAF